MARFARVFGRPVAAARQPWGAEFLLGSFHLEWAWRYEFDPAGTVCELILGAPGWAKRRWDVEAWHFGLRASSFDGGYMNLLVGFGLFGIAWADPEDEERFEAFTHGD